MSDLKKEKTVQLLLNKTKESLRNVKQETVEEKKSEEKKILRGLGHERMKRFLSLSLENLPKPQAKKFACEKDIDELKRPVDTLRCEKCGVMHERVNYPNHVTICKGQLSQKSKFGCTSCSYTNFNIEEIQDHIRRVHKNK